MSRQATVRLFKLNELSETAKEAARQWYREHGLDHAWYETVYEDAASIADMLGIDLRTKKVQFRNGETRWDGINILFSGFYSQGDGACFEGSYRYAKGAAKEIRAYAPQDTELHRIADKLQAIQRKHFYKIRATVKHEGHYYHQYCTSINVSTGDFDYPDCSVQKEVAELLRDFMHWIYKSLEREYEWQNADEQVDETIAANEWEFTEVGQRQILVGNLH